MANEQKKSDHQWGLWIIIVVLVIGDAIVACGGISLWLFRYIPHWTAIIVGIPIGVVLLFSFYTLIFHGGADIMDFIVPHFIILVLAAVLFPVFKHARDVARHEATETRKQAGAR